MVFRLFDNGIIVNRIAADEEFCASYCSKHGYTYEAEPYQDMRSDILRPTEFEILRADVDLALALLGADI